jgi:hypothetical protein
MKPIQPGFKKPLPQALSMAFAFMVFFFTHDFLSIRSSQSLEQPVKSQITKRKIQMVRQAHHPEPSRRANLKIQ